MGSREERPYTDMKIGAKSIGATTPCRGSAKRKRQIPFIRTKHPKGVLFFVGADEGKYAERIGSREPLKTATPSEGPLWGIGDTLQLQYR
jgi:hypothetical protein